MTINNKQSCIDSLCGNLTRSAIWRRGLQAKYNDPRNGKAAETLASFCRETAEFVLKRAISPIKPGQTDV
jgi:hypothetical protein